MVRFFAAALCLLLIGGAAEARNTPCSQGKGGIKACQGTKYLCNNGTISASKYPCTGRGEVGLSDDEAGGGMGSSRKGKKGKR